jgi:hypothetical protein
VLIASKVTDYELTARARNGKETVVSYNATTFHDRDRHSTPPWEDLPGPAAKVSDRLD